MEKFKTPLKAFLHWERETPDQEFLRQYHKGKLEIMTYAEAGKQARSAAAYILDKGLAPKSKIALLSKNCDLWILADLAIMMSGHTSVPIYPTLKAESIKPIVEHSEAAMVIFGKLDDFEAQKKAFSDLPSIVLELSPA